MKGQLGFSIWRITHEFAVACGVRRSNHIEIALRLGFRGLGLYGVMERNWALLFRV